MPSKNSLKTIQSKNFYHIYNRGANKQVIFLDEEDKNKLLSLFARYLDPYDKSKRSSGGAYPKFYNNIELVSYCLMDNHFHLLVYVLDDPTVLPKIMSGILTSYSMYFNSKYKHSGTLFQGVYKASDVDEENYLNHITRYIHKNPTYYKEYAYSSYKYYLSNTRPSWLKPDRVLARFTNTQVYSEFVDKDLDAEELEELKKVLADQSH